MIRTFEIDIRMCTRRTCLRLLFDSNRPGLNSKNKDHFFTLITTGNNWIIAFHAIICQDFQREKKHLFSITPISANQPDNRIEAICKDNSEKLWIGTNSGGLNLLNEKTGTLINYTREQGLPNNVIFGILEDKHGNLWLSTNQELSKFDPKAGIFRNYSIEDGLQGYEYFPYAYYKSKQGEMFFGGAF